jgi:hypothetical protein
MLPSGLGSTPAMANAVSRWIEISFTTLETFGVIRGFRVQESALFNIENHVDGRNPAQPQLHPHKLLIQPLRRDSFASVIWKSKLPESPMTVANKQRRDQSTGFLGAFS